MNTNYGFFFNRFLAEDVHAAELQVEYPKLPKHVKAAAAPMVNKKEIFAEAVWEKMYGKKRPVVKFA
ncbi:MAG: hypothetical protein J6P72_01415 [Firmicutes bacterium]|nr:hypothetical protein [Bacillota bacterium]